MDKGLAQAERLRIDLTSNVAHDRQLGKVCSGGNLDRGMPGHATQVLFQNRPIRPFGFLSEWLLDRCKRSPQPKLRRLLQFDDRTVRASTGLRSNTTSSRAR